MAVRLIPCRHTGTGLETEIAETALGYFPDYERLDKKPDAQASADQRQAEPEPGGERPPGTDDPSKPATGAAKKK